MEPNWRTNELKPSYVLGLIRRAISPTLAGIALGAAVGVLYLGFASPKYRAEAVLLLGADAQGSGDVETLLLDLDTHVNLLQSDAMIGKVISNLDIADRFAESDGLLVSALNLGRDVLSRPTLGEVRDLDDMVEDADKRAAEVTESADVAASVSGIRRGLLIRHLDDTRLLSISFSAASPEMSAKVANGLAEAYIEHLKALNGRQSEIQTIVRDGVLSIDISQEQVAPLLPTAGVFEELKIVSAATPPLKHSSPRVRSTIFVFAFLGLLLGAGVATRREWRSRG